MVYISYKQYKRLSDSFELSKVEKTKSGLYQNMYKKYECDSIQEIVNDGHVVGFVMSFDCANTRLFALELQETRINNFLVSFLNQSCTILNKVELYSLFSDENDSASVIEKRVLDVVIHSNEAMRACTEIHCAGGCNIKVWGSKKIPVECINEYLLCCDNKAKEQFTIVGCDNSDYYDQIQSIFNTVQYLFQMRVVNKARLISEGNGYVFFEIANYVIGYQKYYNFLDSPLTYYIIDRNNNIIFIYALNKWDQQVLRAGQALIAYTNVLRGGINLHASALAINNKGILLLGDKNAGKTTNMLFGLKHDTHMKLVSNDIVHVSFEGGILMGTGSCRKVTIRPGTIRLFPELQDAANDVYSSVGNPQSSNVQIVKSIYQLAKLFKSETQPCVKIKLMVLIQYTKEAINPTVERVCDEEKISIIQKNCQLYYNGREKFWNDVFPCDVNVGTFDLNGVNVVRVHVSEQNIYRIWQILTSYLI